MSDPRTFPDHQDDDLDTQQQASPPPNPAFGAPSPWDLSFPYYVADEAGPSHPTAARAQHDSPSDSPVGLPSTAAYFGLPPTTASAYAYDWRTSLEYLAAMSMSESQQTVGEPSARSSQGQSPSNPCSPS